MAVQRTILTGTSYPFRLNPTFGWILKNARNSANSVDLRIAESHNPRLAEPVHGRKLPIATWILPSLGTVLVEDLPDSLSGIGLKTANHLDGGISSSPIPLLFDHTV